MATGSMSQFGAAAESTWGTAVAVTRFFEAAKEDVTGKYDRQDADALSASRYTRADRFIVAPKGAEGSLTLEVLSKGFGFWLPYMVGGTVSTGAAEETVVYTHTASGGSLNGKSFTFQVGRPRSDDVIVPWTYAGGKITKWELSNDVDKTLSCELSMDFATEACPTSPTGPFALASPTLASNAEVLGWSRAYLELGGSQVPVTDVSVSMDLGLETDRYKLRGSSAKLEQVENDKRKIEASFKTDYDSETFWRLVAANTAAGSLASLHVRWESLAKIGTTKYAALDVTIPAFRLDEGAPNVDGPSMLEQSISGVGLDNGTDSPITLKYTTLDPTP